MTEHRYDPYERVDWHDCQCFEAQRNLDKAIKKGRLNNFFKACDAFYDPQLADNPIKPWEMLFENGDPAFVKMVLQHAGKKDFDVIRNNKDAIFWREKAAEEKWDAGEKICEDSLPALKQVVEYRELFDVLDPEKRNIPQPPKFQLTCQCRFREPAYFLANPPHPCAHWNATFDALVEARGFPGALVGKNKGDE